MRKKQLGTPAVQRTLRLRVRVGGVAVDVVAYEPRGAATRSGEASRGRVVRVRRGSQGIPSRKRVERSRPARTRRTGPHVILFVAANPDGSLRLRLAEESAEIARELRQTLHRDDLQFEPRGAVSIDELLRSIDELAPTVLHISGHGDGQGLLLQDARGQPERVSARALAMIIHAAGRTLRVVVLNVCHSAMYADALRREVECVVCMDGEIQDVAARVFATRLYGALGNGRSVANAVEQGVAALAAYQLSDELVPRHMTRDGVDASHVVLAGPR